MSLDASDFARKVDEEARLIVLRALAVMPSGILTDNVINDELERFGHRRSRDWLHTQIDKLADIGAVEVRQEGSVRVVAILAAGLDHVDRRAFLTGVRRPSIGR